MKRLLLLLFTALVLSPAVLMNRPTLQAAGPAQNQKPPNQKQFNLQGVWDDGGDVVHISQNGPAVTAKWEKTTSCKHGGTEESYQSEFKSTLVGNRLTGEATYCNYGDEYARGKQWGRIELTVSADGNTLSATQYMKDVRKDGTTENKVDYVMKRSCKEDKERLCGSVAAASQALEYMTGDNTVASAAESYALFQGYLREQLDKLSAEICADNDLQNKIDQ
ncbi:MAG: hypothetical protein ACRD2L_01560, partial [Terriglobia bacterium]